MSYVGLVVFFVFVSLFLFFFVLGFVVSTTYGSQRARERKLDAYFQNSCFLMSP